MGAELTKLTCEMFPSIEEILPKKKWGWGGSAQIKGKHAVLINVFSLIPLFTSAERLLRTSGSMGHSDLVTDDLFNPRGYVVEDSANLLYSTLTGSSNKPIDQIAH